MFSNIIYNGPVKGKRTFFHALENGAIINLDAKRELDWLEESGVKHQIQFSLMNDRCEIYLDTTGAPLFKRGYKLEQTTAKSYWPYPIYTDILYY